MFDRVMSHFQIGWGLFKARAGVFVVSMIPLVFSSITDKSAGPLAAPRDAAVLARGNCSQLGALFLIAFLLNAAGAAILGLGLVISIPVSLLAIAGFYRSLQPATA
jgi:uncharacterized membrane protein